MEKYIPNKIWIVLHGLGDSFGMTFGVRIVGGGGQDVWGAASYLQLFIPILHGHLQLRRHICIQYLSSQKLDGFVDRFS